MPTGHRKLEKLSELIGKLWKSYRKAIGKSSTGLQSRQILAVQQYDATNGLPSVKTAKEDDNDNFQLSSASTLPRQANALERFCSEPAFGSEELFHTAKTFATQTNANREKKTMKFFFRSMEDFSDCF